jgi:RimJ/RimL family protein N-acetyltransferase
MFAITERLLLRPGWAEDAPATAAEINDATVARNLLRVPHPYSVKDAAAFFAERRPPTRPEFVICRRDTGRIVGGIGLHGDLPELGYWIGRDHRGHGFATEAARAVVAIADDSLRLPLLMSGHALDNPASARVLTKLGFSPTGQIVAQPSLGRGEPMRVALYRRDRTPAERALAA